MEERTIEVGNHMSTWVEGDICRVRVSRVWETADGCVCTVTREGGSNLVRSQQELYPSAEAAKSHWSSVVGVVPKDCWKNRVLWAVAEGEVFQAFVVDSAVVYHHQHYIVVKMSKPVVRIVARGHLFSNAEDAFKKFLEEEIARVEGKL